MKKVKIKSNNKDVSIECPSCDNWEEISIDQSRKDFQSIPIIDWKPKEISINKCCECKTEFEVEWDYKK